MKHQLLVTGVALASIAFVQPFRPFVVSGTSMTPTFRDGQILVANVRPHSLTRGDVVVFHHDNETMVKRIAYIPGDTIERFWFAGEWKLPSTKSMLRAMIDRRLPLQRCVIPNGYVYVLADNPDGSVDSRTFGSIPATDVVAVIPNVNPAAQWSIDGAQQGSALVARL